MLKSYLLSSLGLSRLFSQVLAFVYHRASSCGGACQRSTCNGARIRKHFNARNVRIKIAVSQFDLRVQKQLYLRNTMGYPHQILNEDGKRINNTESGEISKNFLTDLYRFLAWTVTYDVSEEMIRT